MKKIELKGDVGYEITADFIRSQIATPTEDLLLMVNSPGGFVLDGIEIFNLIKNHAGKTIAVVDGLAASAASYFIMAADEIHVRNNSIFMGHKAWNLIIGNADEMRKQAEIMDGFDGIIADGYIEKNKSVNKKQMLKMMSDEIWLFGEEIANNGFATKFVNDSNKLDDVNQAKSQAYASIMNVKNKMQKDDRLQDKCSKAAAWFNDNRSILVNSNININSKKTGGTNKMTKEEIKNQFPDVYNSIIADGVNQERDRVSAFVVFNEIDPAGVKAGIESGENLSQKAMAEFSLKALNRKALDNLSADGKNLADIKNEAVDVPKVEEKKVSKEAEDVEARIMARYNKGGK